MSAIYPPGSPRTQLFRAIVAILQADPDLSAAVETWNVWDGDTTDKQGFSSGTGVSIELLPKPVESQWMSEQSFRGDFIVNVGMMIPGANIDDVLDLWYLIERAFYPTDATQRTTVQSTLRSNGSYTGLISFLQPAVAVDNTTKTAPMWIAQGLIKADIELTYNA